MTRQHALHCTLLCALLCLSAPAAITWDFMQSATPSGAKLNLLAGTAAVAQQDGVAGLAPNTQLDWASDPQLHIQPGFGIAGEFFLHELKDTVQVIAMKDGEYILRVDWAQEGGYLSFFVNIEGKWETRLRGPVIKANTWYDVTAAWSGLELTMTVNGESFSLPRIGRINPASEPLQIGPVAGIIKKLEITNPSFERRQILSDLVGDDDEDDEGEDEGDREDKEEDSKEPNAISLDSPRSRWSWLMPWTWGHSHEQDHVVIGGKNRWQRWQTKNGMDGKFRRDSVECLPASASGMLISPPLAIPLAAMPFICLEIAPAATSHMGYLDFVTDSGVGTICFKTSANGSPTIIAGTLANAWTGTLRRLALSFAGDKNAPLVIHQAVIADSPVGTPSFYIRSLVPGRAKLRPGRTESVVLGLQNLGGEAENISAKLSVPKGITIIGKAKQSIAYLGLNDFDMATWHFQVKEPGTYTATVTVSTKTASRSQDITLLVEPMPALPPQDYVPMPIPAKTDYINLMHYCALWKEGTHYGWKRIEPWPERRPAIGWYDEGTPEVADWHIKYALEHGVNGFIYCWYRSTFDPEITQSLGHAIHEGLFNAKARDMFNFTIMWENGCAKGVKDEADLLDNVLPFWIKNYFTHPSYLKIENQPVLFIWQPKPLIEQLGGPEKTAIAFDKMREQCRQNGFAGLRIIACMPNANPVLGGLIAQSGWDALTGYNLQPSGVPIAGYDPAGLAYRDHADVLSRYKQTWIDRDATTGDLPDIPNVVMGRDDRAWGRVHPGRDSYIANPQAKNFEAACRDAKELVDAKPAGRWDSKMVVFDNWTEFGEGHYLEPTTGTGFSFVNAIKRVFCSSWADEKITDIIPEDIGLPPPQRRYEDVRAGFGKRLPWQPLRIQGDLIAQWDFDSESNGFFPDSTRNGCDLKADKVTLSPNGRHGQALLCGTGGANIDTPAPFYHPGGISIALWCNPSEPKQGNRWMINTAGTTSGYRIGLSDGKPSWQIPREAWSHGLTGPETIPVNQWTHIATTFDNRIMRLYINGKEVATREREGFIIPNTTMTIGGYSTNMDNTAFLGLLDKVQIYRRVLTPAEIATLAE